MRRPYLFEILVLVNLAAIAVLAHESIRYAGSPLMHAIRFAIALAVHAAAGIAIRAVIALLRRDRRYLRTIRRPAWIADTLRLITGGAVLITTYGWIKLVVPVYHPRLFDQELWNLDQILFFGLSPTVLFLDLFSDGLFLRFIDWSYAQIFMFSAFIAFAYFLSHPRRRVRVAFANGNTVLWLAGAWLYMLVPSLGPAYRFPEIWFAHSESLRHTHAMQALLMRNYQNVLRAAADAPVRDQVRIVLGIGAFPSLHVAFQMYVFLWTRRLWTSGKVLFGTLVVVIFLGSMVTGWHYFVDGVAGLVLAYACWWFASGRGRGRRHTR